MGTRISWQVNENPGSEVWVCVCIMKVGRQSGYPKKEPQASQVGSSDSWKLSFLFPVPSWSLQAVDESLVPDGACGDNSYFQVCL